MIPPQGARAGAGLGDAHPARVLLAAAMLKALRVQYTFPVTVELSDGERTEIVREALTAAEELDRGDDEAFVFSVERHGQARKVYLDIGRRQVHITTQAEESKAGLPGPGPGQHRSAGCAPRVTRLRSRVLQGNGGRVR